MAKALVIEKHQFAHIEKVAGVSGQSPLRDVALLAVASGLALQPNEIARLRVSDYLNADGSLRRVSRTFAVQLRRNGTDLATIRRLLGLSSLSAVKRIVDGDPVRLGAIVARII